MLNTLRFLIIVLHAFLLFSASSWAKESACPLPGDAAVQQDSRAHSRIYSDLRDGRTMLPAVSSAASPSVSGEDEAAAYMEKDKPLKGSDQEEENPLAEEEAELTPDELRQLDTVEARIRSRLGEYGRALQMYGEMRRKYPADVQIWEDFIETLIDNGDYEKAISEIRMMERSMPLSVRTSRLEARIYVEARNPERAITILDDVMRKTGRDTGIVSDYAYARLGIGDQAGALRHFTEVLEASPDNQPVRDAVKQILRDRSPRADMAYRMYYQPADAVTKTGNLGFSSPVNERGRMSFLYGYTTVDRPYGTSLFKVREDISEGVLTAAWRLGERWRADIGGRAYSGIGGGFSPMAGIEYNYPRLFRFRLDYENHQPWFDPVDAAAFKGYQRRVSAAIQSFYRDRWAFALGLEDINYYLGDQGYYGHKTSGTFIVTRRIAQKPELYLSYGFTQSSFSYAVNEGMYVFSGQALRPVSMLGTESLHSFSANSVLDISPYLTASLAGGYRYDMARTVGAWFAAPSVRLKFRNRFDCEGSYEYTSEAQSTTSGSSSLYNFRCRWIW